MDDYFDRVTLPQRLGAAAAMATAVLELALAVMALYGVIAFAASQRRREIGLRMALGASSRSVITLIMREGLLLTPWASCSERAPRWSAGPRSAACSLASDRPTR